MKKSLFSLGSIVFAVVLLALAGCSKTTTTTSTQPVTTSTTTPIQTSVPVTTTTSTVSTAPMVSTVNPSPGDSNVPVNYLITATFTSEGAPDTFYARMNPATINVNTFTLWLGTTPVSGVVTYSGDQAIFNPASDLTLGATYTAKLTTGIADNTGSHMAQDYSWSFVAGAADTVSPTVSGTTPADGDVSVPSNNSINAYFSEAMDPATINTTTFTLMQGTTPVVGTVTYDGVRTATFNPTGALLNNTAYTATITTGVACAADKPMLQNFSWSFTTGVPQATTPTVVSFLPLAGAAGEPINDVISATFSEPVDPMTINTATFSLWQGSTPVPGTVEFDGVDSAVFMPLTDLSMNTTYTVQLSTDITDAGGIHMGNMVSWSFTTGTADTVLPTVISMTPASGATNVAVNGPFSIVFSESIDPTSFTFNLLQGNYITSCIISWDAAFKTVTITPANPLAANTAYQATFSGASDLAGNGQLGNSWSFTTAP